MAVTAAAIGTAILGAGAGATAATITGGLVLGAASYGAASLMSDRDSGGPGSYTSPAPVGSHLADKTLPTQADQLDDPLVGDEKESERRKRAAAKSRFKVPLADPMEQTGVTGLKDKPTGVQI